MTAAPYPSSMVAEMTETQTDPIRRGRLWVWPDGTTLPVISGGSDDSGSEGSDGTEGGTDDGAGGSEGADGTEGSDSGGSKLELTQAELDAMFDKRLGRARKQWEQEAKTKAERENLDEVDRLKAEKADADKAAADALAKADQRLVQSEAKVLAAAAGVKPGKLAHLLRLADLDGIDVTDGEVDSDAVQAAVDKVLADLPELAAAKTAGRSGQEMTSGGAGKVWTRAEISKMSQAEYEKHEDAILEQMRTTGIK